MLVNAVKNADIGKTLKSLKDYHPFAKYGEREAWEALPEEFKWFIGGVARASKGYEWPIIPAARWMDFMRNGDRSAFQKIYFERRDKLYIFVMAECVEGLGNYIDDIINGVWAICEESSWVVSAHLRHAANVFGVDACLPNLDIDPPYIDLFAAETGALIAWTHYMLGERLAQESTLIPRRMELEMQRRIFCPYLEEQYYNWSGLNADRVETFINNWNPWINSNVLNATLLMCPNDGMRCALVEKLCRSTQKFIDTYHMDGGCDEGPSYFGEAGAALFDFLEDLHCATGGAVDIFGEELIKNIGRYIMYMHVADDVHVNFADAPTRLKPNCMLLMRYGRMTGQDDLYEYARHLQASGNGQPVYRLCGSNYNIFRLMRDVFMYSPDMLRDTRAIEPRQHYFPGIQVMTARSVADSAEGLFIAAKGGHNAESHNHNDVGNYIIALDGEVLVGDAGVETYSRKTFSEERYTIWAMQSGYHNTAIVNGCDQLPGAQYAASAVCYEDGDVPALAQDMAGAYPAEAGLRAYVRAVRLDRAAERITVSDTVAMESGTLTIPVLCTVEPALSEGQAVLRAGRRALRLSYDAQHFEASVERIELTDAKLRGEWRRPALYRLLLTRRENTAQDEFMLVYDIID